MASVSLFVAGCQEDPEEAANKLFVESTQSIAEAESINSETGPDLEKKAALLQVAVQKLNQIVSDYPAATLAVEIASTGGAKGIEIVELKGEIATIEEKVKCVNEPSSRSCVLVGDLERLMEDGKLSEIEQLSPFFAAMNNFVAVENSIEKVQETQKFNLDTVVSLYLFASAYENLEMVEKLKNLGNSNRFLSVIRTIDGFVKVRKLESTGKYLDASEELLKLKRSNEANMIMGRANFGRVFQIASAALAAGKKDEAAKIADASVTAIKDGWLRADPMNVLVLMQIYGAAGNDAEKATAYELLQIPQLLGCSPQDMLGLNAIERQLEIALVAKEANDSRTLDFVSRCVEAWYNQQLENNYWDSFFPQIDSYTKVLVALGESETAKDQLSKIMTDQKDRVAYYADSVALALLAVGDGKRAEELLSSSIPGNDDLGVRTENHVGAALELQAAGVEIGPALSAFLSGQKSTRQKIQTAFDLLSLGKLDEASDAFAAAFYQVDTSERESGISQLDRASRAVGQGMESYLGLYSN